MSFDGLEYTRQSILEELALIERHARDGSAVEGGCACIEEKHLLNLSGLASEGVTLASDKAEKEYYMALASWARNKRNEIINGKFSLDSCEVKIQDCMSKGLSKEECRSKIHCH